MIVRENWINRISTQLAILGMLLFAFSRYSWGYIFSNRIWGAILFFSCVLFAFPLISSSQIVLHKNSCALFLLIMLIVMGINRNYDIENRGAASVLFPYWCIFILYIFCYGNGLWIDFSNKVFMFWGTFYGLFTIASNINTTFYYKFVNPLMAAYSRAGGTSYMVNPAAGFTSHYSINGIYLAQGFCVASSMFFFKDDKRNRLTQIPIILIIIITGVSVFMSGKRGVLLCLFIALLACYWIYEINSKNTRLIKIIGVLLVLSMVFFILSQIFPQIGYVFERFATLKQQGDASNGRLALWKYAIPFIKKRPWIGYGWRWFMYHNPLFRGADLHNCYLQLILENGIIGSIPFFCFFAISTLRAIKIAKLVRLENTNMCEIEVRNIYMFLMIQIFNMLFMFEGTALYMPQCVMFYLMSCAGTEYYYSLIEWKHHG